MTITNNPDNVIIPHFKESEFFGRTTAQSHYLDDRLIQAAAYLRQVYGVPVTITSTYRSPEYNALIGGSKNSQHLKGKAIDLQFEKQNLFHEDIANRGPHYRYLRAMGIKGFGLYQNFTHLDARGDNPGDVFNNSDQYGPLAFWDNRKKIVPQADPEDGYKGQSRQITGFVALLVILTILAIFTFKN